MLKPNKYTSVKLSVIGISAEVIKLMRDDPSQKYNELQNKVISRLGESAKQNFLLALTFLFATGKILYYPKEDVLELVGAKS